MKRYVLLLSLFNAACIAAPTPAREKIPPQISKPAPIAATPAPAPEIVPPALPPVAVTPEWLRQNAVSNETTAQIHRMAGDLIEAARYQARADLFRELADGIELGVLIYPVRYDPTVAASVISSNLNPPAR